MNRNTLTITAFTVALFCAGCGSWYDHDRGPDSSIDRQTMRGADSKNPMEEVREQARDGSDGSARARLADPSVTDYSNHRSTNSIPMEEVREQAWDGRNGSAWERFTDSSGRDYSNRRSMNSTPMEEVNEQGRNPQRSFPSEITSRPCPFDCNAAGYSTADCRAWRENDTCFVGPRENRIHR